MRFLGGFAGSHKARLVGTCSGLVNVRCRLVNLSGCNGVPRGHILTHIGFGCCVFHSKSKITCLKGSKAVHVIASPRGILGNSTY